MFVDKWLHQIEPEGKRALVFAAGGGADIIFVRWVSQRLIDAGASSVDIAQAANRSSFDSEISAKFALVNIEGLISKVVMMFGDVVANDNPDDGTRGKGTPIAAATAWDHGDRLLFAAKRGAGGTAALAKRSWKPSEPYDIAIAVDGGGDVLTGGPDEFDRVVLDAFRENWNPDRPLRLLIVGLGADLGSTESEFTRTPNIEGWDFISETKVDLEASREIEKILAATNRLHPTPEVWRTSDEHWSRGLHVPQIVALAVQSRLPESSRGLPYVIVPRPVKRKVPIPTEPQKQTGEPWPELNGDLLRTAIWFACKKE